MICLLWYDHYDIDYFDILGKNFGPNSSIRSWDIKVFVYNSSISKFIYLPPLTPTISPPVTPTLSPSLPLYLPHCLPSFVHSLSIFPLSLSSGVNGRYRDYKFMFSKFKPYYTLRVDSRTSEEWDDINFTSCLTFSHYIVAGCNNGQIRVRGLVMLCNQ